MLIATWNLDHALPPPTARGLAIRDRLRSLAADVLVLTETDSGHAPSSEYAGTHATRRPGEWRPTEHWVSVWSRLPIRRQIKTVDPARCVCVEINHADERPLLVYGTVLPWLSDDSQAPIPQGGSSFVKALEDQADDWRRLLREHPDADLCIAGDFNQDLNDEHTYGSRIGKQRLREVLAELSLTCVTCDPDDPVKRATSSARGNIDHIVVSSRLAAAADPAEAWAPLGPTGSQLSDHHGVWAKFG